MKCSSCGTDISALDKYAKFKCASCNKAEITRCQSCKATANKFTCKCGFIGP